MTPLEFVSLDPVGFINLFGTRRISPSEILRIIEENVERVIKSRAGRMATVSKGLRISIVNPYEDFYMILCTYLDTAVDIYTCKEEMIIHKTHLEFTNRRVSGGTRIFGLVLKEGKATVTKEDNTK